MVESYKLDLLYGRVEPNKEVAEKKNTITAAKKQSTKTQLSKWIDGYNFTLPNKDFSRFYGDCNQFNLVL